MEEQFDKAIEWQNKTFTKATKLSCVNHLLEEVKELKEDIECGKHSPKEIADCFLLLFAICERSNMIFQDIVDCIKDKMEINYTRTWGTINDQGYVNHIREE